MLTQNKVLSLSALAILSQLVLVAPSRAQYTVEPPGSIVRGHLWIGDGIAGVFSSNRRVGDRLRIGAELHLGSDYQFILGMTLLDRIWSGEKEPSVGDISRRGTGFNFGYYVTPDRLWLMYTLQLEDLSGSAVIGTVSHVAHQVSVGYRFYTDRMFNLALEAAYLFSPSYSASTFDFSTNLGGSADFPVANIWSLNLRFGFDIGGR